jgi:hypothetical protein
VSIGQTFSQLSCQINTPPARTHCGALLAAYTFLSLTYALLRNDDIDTGVNKRAMHV